MLDEEGPRGPLVTSFPLRAARSSPLSPWRFLTCAPERSTSRTPDRYPPASQVQQVGDQLGDHFATSATSSSWSLLRISIGRRKTRWPGSPRGRIGRAEPLVSPKRSAAAAAAECLRLRTRSVSSSSGQPAPTARWSCSRCRRTVRSCYLRQARWAGQGTPTRARAVPARPRPLHPRMLRATTGPVTAAVAESPVDTTPAVVLLPRSDGCRGYRHAA